MDKQKIVEQLKQILNQANEENIVLIDAENTEYKINSFYIDEDNEIYFECREIQGDM